MVTWWRLVLAMATLCVALGVSTPVAAQVAAGPPPILIADTEVEGEVEVLVEDSPTGARTLHVLHVGQQRIPLNVADNSRPSLETGMRVRARGRLNANGTMTLATANNIQTFAAPAVPNTFGDQRTIVILVNFTDKATEPYTTATAHAVTFQQTSNYFLENSYGQTWLTGDVYGWYTIPLSSTSCDYNQIASLADSAVTNAGVSLSAYRRRIYAFPSNACTWWGLGSVGGNPSRSWINGSYALKVVGHELGHNFGDYHSHSRPCDTAGCSMVEYGDTHDIMGNPSSGHLNTFQKERLGWLDYAAQPPVSTVTAPGDYWIEGMSAPRAGAPKALRVSRGLDTSGRRLWYYLEARVRTGADANIAAGVLVHTATENDASSSNLVDLAPLTTAFDAVLDQGQAMIDDIVGVTVTTLWTTATGAMVNVNFNTQPCYTSWPVVSLSPGGTTSAVAGAPTSFSVSVTSHDSSSCPADVFNLSSVVPTGWTGTFGQPTLTIAPGTTATTSFVLTSTAAASGAFGYRVSAVRSGPSGTMGGTISIVAALNLTVTATPRFSHIVLTSTTMAGAQPSAGTTVSFRIIDPAGMITLLASTTDFNGVATARFRPARSAPNGLYQVRVSATSGALVGIGNTMFVR
jgi:hypothetical protein